MIDCTPAYIVSDDVHILLAREDYPETAAHSPLLDRLTPDGRTHRKRLADMLHDLERLHAGWVPDERDLAGAPCLSAWRSVRPFGSRLPVLTGVIEAHPVLAGPLIVTSPVVAHDGRTFRWVRTISRFYRLDRPFREGEH
jgi:hypothetical protein